MPTFLYPSRFQLKSDYFPKNPIQSTQNTNIYLGGTKSPNQEKKSKSKSKSKGITLTKFITSPQKLSNHTYIRQTQSKFYPFSKPQTQNLDSSQKPNFPTNLPKIAPSVTYSVKRTFSSPLINKFKINSSSVLTNSCFGNKRILHQNLLPERNHAIFRLTPSSSLHSSMSYFPGHLSQSFSERNFPKIQYVNPTEQLRLNSHSREKVIFISQNQKNTFSTRFASDHNKSSDSRLLSTNHSQNKIEKNGNIYFQMRNPQPVQKVIKHQIYRPIKIVNKFRPTSPLPMQRESLEAICQTFGQKEEFKNYHQCLTSLKHSKSTAEEQKSPYNSSELLEDGPNQKMQKNVQNGIKKKPLKNSIKSLWDSVEKQAISVICENPQENPSHVWQTGLNQANHKIYNNLGSDSHFSSLVLSKMVNGIREECRNQ